VSAPEPINVADFERLAAERLDPGVLGYFAGGAGDERTLRDNVAAFGRRRLRPRVLVDVADVTTATTVLGT
jgi:(S)-2-hydroxy-acid oxidase/4-hydroxymandelate oxidase